MQDTNKQLTSKIINKDKWWDLLSRFIDVLRINLFIVDAQGGIILPPEEGRCGGKLLTDPKLGFDLLHHPTTPLLKHFSFNGTHLEAVNRFKLSSFAIPINTDKDSTIAYLIVGPVILNKLLEEDVYRTMAREYNTDPELIIREIYELRVVSNLMMASILNLLSEIVRDNVELSLGAIEKDKSPAAAANPQVSQMAQEISSMVLMDELLVTFLDIALKMTDSDGGSIMILDENLKDLTIKVSRGINQSDAEKTRLKLGEGIAGIAAQENKLYLLRGQTSPHNRIHNLLKRPEIKQSLVMPLSNKSGVVGVLNLHSKNKISKIEENLDNLKYLSQLLSSAI